MKQTKTILREEREVDSTTGELLRHKQVIQYSKEPAYVKLYLDSLGVFISNEGLSKSLNDMLVEAMKMITYASDEQLLTLGKYQKEKICKATGKSKRRLEQAITIWVENNVLIRVARSTYRLNPYIFGKGEWRDIENLRATFDYRNGTVETEIEYEKDEEKQEEDKAS